MKFTPFAQIFIAKLAQRRPVNAHTFVAVRQPPTPIHNNCCVDCMGQDPIVCAEVLRLGAIRSAILVMLI